MKRVPRGTLRVEAEVGTILGPTDVTREYLVVTACRDGLAQVGYATPDDLAAVRDPDHAPRSLTEIQLRRFDVP